MTGRHSQVRARSIVGFLLALVVSVVLIVVALISRSETSTTDLRNGRAFIQDNLWSTEDHQYAVWTGPDGDPLVGQRRRGGGEWTVESLGSLPGNPLAAPTEQDLHNVYVIGVDGQGFVHVAGNMHADPLRYVRSTRPRDITEWEDAAVAGPAQRVTYPMFTALPDGTLLFVRREGDPGRGDILLDALPPGRRQWEHRGVIISGSMSDEGPYLHRIAVDEASGMLHVLIVWRGDLDPITNNDVSYARSPDGGSTWERADGSSMPGPVTHDGADLVVDTADRGSGLVNNGGLAVDRDGHPHGVIGFDRPNEGRSFVHVWHDGASWRREPIARWEGSSRPAVSGHRDGTVWMMGSVESEIVAMRLHPRRDNTPRPVAPAPQGWEPTFDTPALHRTGSIETFLPKGSEPRVRDVPRRSG